jgi:hypothetical protein
VPTPSTSVLGRPEQDAVAVPGGEHGPTVDGGSPSQFPSQHSCKPTCDLIHIVDGRESNDSLVPEGGGIR